MHHNFSTLYAESTSSHFDAWYDMHLLITVCFNKNKQYVLSMLGNGHQYAQALYVKLVYFYSFVVPYHSEKFLRYSDGWSLPFHGLIFMDAHIHAHYALYNWAYFASLIFTISWLSTKFGPLKYPHYMVKIFYSETYTV